jgi:uncharacterized repeat protein (TIGR01451 family)
VQEALDAAKDGYEIRIATGFYTDVYPHAPPSGYNGPDVITQVLYIDVDVTVRGGYTITDWTTSHPITQPSILDAQQQGRALFVAGGAGTQILGVHIRGGDATGLGGGTAGEDTGGGIYVWDAPITISGCQVLTSTAFYGAGMYLYGSEAILYGNEIAFNTSGWDGGGLYARGGDVKLRQTRLISNAAKYGGGLYAYESDIEVSHSVITGNLAYASGGGLFIYKGQATLATNNVRANATGSENGGGMFIWDSIATLDNNLIQHNTAEARGGGLFIWLTDAVLGNNVVANNTSTNGGTGLYIQGASPKLRHTTIADNAGGSGVFVTNDGDYHSTAMMTNTILVSHTVGISVTLNNTTTLEATLWGNATNGAGNGDVFSGTLNVFGGPDFLDPANGDYHIGPSSAAINAGVFSDVSWDIDEERRPMGGGYDLGADEYPDAFLQLEQTARPLWLNPGQMVTYTLTVANLGGRATNQVWLTDTLPPMQAFITFTTSQGNCTLDAPSPDRGVCDIGTILPGDTVHLTLTARTTGTIPGGTSALPLYMDNVASVKASNTVRQSASAETVLQNCHVRLNDRATAYASVQAAVDASPSPTDVVKVAGYCVGVNTSQDAQQPVTLTQHVHISKSLILRGGYTPTNWTTPYPLTQPTTLDALGRGRVLFISGDEDKQTVHLSIENLHITGGDAQNLGGYIDSKGKVYNTGGGICALSATVTLSNSHIVGNRTGWSPAYGWGGGLYMEHSTAVLTGNVIADNVADAYSDPESHFSDSYGGGFYLRESTGTFTRNTFISNTATWEGGGLYILESPVTLSANTFQSNTALMGAGLLILDSEADLSDNAFYHNVAANGMGGGLSFSSSSVTLTRNTFSGNVSGFGGGINLTGHSVGYLTQNLVFGNHSTLKGGGLRLNGSAVLINNVIAENETDGSGGAIFADDTTLQGYHNTFVANEAGDNTGIYVDNSVMSMTNTILVSHTTGISVKNKSTLVVDGVLWYNTPVTIAQEADATVAVTHASWGDPAFADEPGPSPAYHLTPGSAAIDAGVLVTDPLAGTLADAIAYDIDGDPRPLGNAPDLGVDEILAMAARPDAESTLIYTDTGGGVIVLELPSGAVTDTVTLVYTPIATVTVPLSYTFANHAFELSAYRGGVLLPGFTFLHPLEVTLHYTEEDVAGIDETRLMLYEWNETTSAWEDAACGAYVRDAANNRLTVPICHVGLFVLMEAPPGGPTEPTSLIITGPVIGLTETAYTFTATVDAATATPITYTWQAQDHAIIQHIHDALSDTAVFSWTTSGLKTIFVTATNGKGWVAKSRHISVFYPVKAAFTSSTTRGVAPLRVTFTDTSESVITAWRWDFGDGATSEAQNPIHTYTSPGVYTVSLAIDGPAGSDSVTRPAYITVSEAPPVAALTADPLKGYVPLEVQFTDLSEGKITEWLWDFGDGITSPQQHPTHTYTSTGVYTVGLRVSGPGGVDTVTHTRYITVATTPPEAAFTGAPLTGIAPLTVVFTDTSQVGQVESPSYMWDFGDGVTSTLQNPTHIYATPGVYTVSLTVTSPGGVDHMTRARYISVLTPPPEADFIGAPRAGLNPLTVVFTDTSQGATSQWLWDFGDGVTSTTQNPTHIYTTPGTYTVDLAISGAGGHDTATKADYVHVSEVPPSAPTANYTATPTEGPAPLNVQFTDTSEGTVTRWLWDFGDGMTSTVQHPTRLYTSAGTYTVTLTITGPGGTDTVTRAPALTVTHAPPEAAFTGAPLTGVAPLTVVFTNTSNGGQAASLSSVWDFGDGVTSTVQHPTHTYTQTGTFTVRLTVSGPGGHDTETKVNYVHVDAPQLRAGFVATPTEGLAPLNVHFTDISEGVITSGPWTSTWTWNFGDSATSVARNPDHIYTQAGVYTVSLTVHSLSSSHTLTQTGYIRVNNAITHHVEIPSAPVTGNLNSPITFTAKFTPIRPLSSMIRYTWQATEQATTIEETHHLTSTATFTWREPGSKTVTITVSEVNGTIYAQNVYHITLEGEKPTAPPTFIYLPLVMQNLP